ncbi:hypothetical protein EZS27_010750 [termite gut metagenome]|uniref:Uncharacterized protein n=1 Tax=termite gut metagenome TaxID=433724 RepID=A0A5J4S7X1_9ZZZZ
MEKKFMKYLLFGVFTFVLGIAFVGCGEDYDDDISSLKSADATLQKALDDLKAASVTSSQLTSAVASAAKTEAENALKGLLGGASATDLADVIADIKALQDAFGASGDTKFDSAISSLTALTTELATKAGQSSEWVQAVIGYETRIAALELQVKALAVVNGEGEVVSGIIKEIQDEIAALKLIGGGEGGDIDLVAIADALATDDVFVKKIADQIGDVDSGAVTLGPVNKLITGIAIKAGTALDGASYSDLTNGFDFRAAPAKVNFTFGTVDALVFETGKIQAKSGIVKTLIQVTPSNAELDETKISLVNSQGDRSINQYITVSAKSYSGLLTRADNTVAISSTGLYEVAFALNEDYDKSAFDKLIKNGTKNIAYAIAVENSISDSDASAADRYVLTGFDYKITQNANFFYTTNEATKKWITYTVGTKDVDQKTVEQLYNRGNQKELVWVVGGTYTNPASSSAVVSPGGSEDNRYDATGKSYFSAEIGKAFPVALTGNAKDIGFAYYIGLDTKNATGTTESALWGSANISGLNTVYLASETAKITINDESLKGKTIGFRVYVVNYDGTLVDPDGRAFYASVSGSAVDLGTLNFTTAVPLFSKTYHADGTKPGYPASTGMVSRPLVFNLPTSISAREIYDAVVTFEDVTDDYGDKINDIRVLKFVNAADASGYADKYSTWRAVGTSVFNPDQTNVPKQATSWVSAQYILLDAVRLSYLKDDAFHNGTLKLRNVNGATIGTYKVTLTKHLPDFPVTTNALGLKNNIGYPNVTVNPYYALNTDKDQIVKAAYPAIDIFGNWESGVSIPCVTSAYGTNSSSASVVPRDHDSFNFSVTDASGKEFKAFEFDAPLVALLQNNGMYAFTGNWAGILIENESGISTNIPYKGKVEFNWGKIGYRGDYISRLSDREDDEYGFDVRFNSPADFTLSYGSSASATVDSDNQTIQVSNKKLIWWSDISANNQHNPFNVFSGNQPKNVIDLQTYNFFFSSITSSKVFVTGTANSTVGFTSPKDQPISIKFEGLEFSSNGNGATVSFGFKPLIKDDFEYFNKDNYTNSTITVEIQLIVKDIFGKETVQGLPITIN